MSFLGMIAFVFCAAIVGGILLAVVNASKRRDMTDSLGAIPEFSPSFQYMGPTGDNGIAVDEKRFKVCLLTRTAGQIRHRIIAHTDVISSEIFEDGETVTKAVRSSQIGGVVVGGLLLGGVGAVIGGLSGKRVQQGKVKRIELRLTINDASQPTHTVSFLGQEVARTTLLYKMTAEAARTWQARMDVLIKRADSESHSNAVASLTPSLPAPAGSVADEIRKLADLKAQGLLTQAEFESEKSKLLSRAPA